MSAARLPRILSSVMFGALALYLILPMLAVLIYSLARRWTATILPDGYTIQYWISALQDPRLFGAFVEHLAACGDKGAARLWRRHRTAAGLGAAI